MADSQIEESGIDIEAASERIGASLFGSSAEPDDQPDQPDVLAQPEQPAKLTQPTAPIQADASPSPSDLLPAPKSWRQDMHQHWSKMPREAQQYYNEREQQMLNGMQQYKQIQSVIAPFEQQLSQRGVTAYDWIRGLANAEVMLTQGTPEQRRAAYQQLGKQLGFDQAPTEPQTPIDPMIKQLQDRQEAIERGLRAQQELVVKETRAKVDAQVEAFASDKAHPHFDEVAEDMQVFIRAGASLQDAYDRAVWANPVTRAKEQAAALTAHEAKLRENARLNSLPKRKAAGVNIKSDRDGTEPTEPTGSLEDTIKRVHREIRARA